MINADIPTVLSGQIVCVQLKYSFMLFFWSENDSVINDFSSTEEQEIIYQKQMKLAEESFSSSFFHRFCESILH